MEELSFEQMLEESFRNENFNVGGRVNGRIISFSDEFAFVNITGKTEAIIDISEVRDKSGNYMYSVNDELEFYISAISHDEIKLTVKIGLGYISEGLLRLCHEENIPVYGKIISASDSGFHVSISDMTAFCPLSHLESRLSDELKFYIGKTYDFLIIEFKSGGKNIVVSRRDIIERKISEETENLRSSLKTGQVIETYVTRTEPFGIFVKIGPFEGLVHKSELSLSRIISPESFKIGDTVRAKVKEIDWEQSRFSLSIKDVSDDPWRSEIDKYEAGISYQATAVKFIKSGAFMELEPGIEGYIPLQRMSYIKRVLSPADAMQLNHKYDVRIVEIDRSSKKILLETASDDSNPWNSENDIADSVHECKVEKKIQSGLLVRLENGMEGYIPKSEVPAFDSLSTGDTVTAATIEFDRQNRKLVLSLKAAEEHRERKEVENYIKSNNTNPAGTTLGDMFSDVLKNLKTDR